MSYTCVAASHATNGVIDVAGHINRSRGLNRTITCTGSTLFTSKSMTMAESSGGTKRICRTVNAACA